MKTITSLCLMGSAAILAMVPAVAGAQESGGDADSDDIVVTANRTESLLSKTPIAMSAISGKQLAETGITNPTQLEASVPNLSIVRGNGLQITIRGVSSSDGTEIGDPSASFMTNGIYIARPQTQEVSFFDVERVEVLRGPQGTLYGRNSTAGVVNVISVRPKFEMGGSIDASYSSYDDLNASAAINIPFGDTFAIRAAANIDRRDNYVADGVPNDGVSLDPFKNNKSVRLSALFEPSSDLSVLLIGDYSSIKGRWLGRVAPENFYDNIVAGAANFERPTRNHLSSKRQRTNMLAQAQSSLRDNEDWGVMGEINYNIGFGELTYLGSYREFTQYEGQIFGSGPYGGDFTGKYWQTSHEVRLAVGDGPLKAQIGGYYFKERSNIALFLNNLTVFGFAPNTRFGFPQNPTISDNKSIFGQATYEIAPSLKLTAGVRYSKDTKSRVGKTVLDTYDSVVDSYNIGNLLDRTVFDVNDARASWSKVTWRAGVDYDSALGLIYASVATGYKSGGFNNGCEADGSAQAIANGCTQTAAALYYDPETLTAYEAGFKFKFSPAFFLNGTVFHYDYKNLQLRQDATTLCGGPCQVVTNAASAKVDGVELDARIKPSDRLTADLAFNYTNARYADFEPRAGLDFKGRALSRSPKFTWSAALNYVLPVGDGGLVANARTNFNSGYDLTELSTETYFDQPSFTKTDLSLTYNAPGDRFYVGAFVENLENYLAVTWVRQGAFGETSFSDPRTYGVRAGMKF